MRKLTARTRQCFVCAMVLLFMCVGAYAGRANANASVIPFQVREISGKRPVVHVQLNGHGFDMVVHANAAFFMQINHAEAKTVRVEGAQHAGSFGIEAPGKVSTLGLDRARLGLLKIGDKQYRDVPVSVFETPGKQPGMLGLDWIRASRAVVDFGKSQLVLDPSTTQIVALRQHLLSNGYVAIPIREEPGTGKYEVDVSIGDATRRMMISTVAALNIDEDFARAGGVKSGKVIGRNAGPKGATENAYSTAQPVTLRIGQWTSDPINNAVVEDVYTYASKERPLENPEGGLLGADFMIAYRAVIDFGGSVLYLKKR